MTTERPNDAWKRSCNGLCVRLDVTDDALSHLLATLPNHFRRNRCVTSTGKTRTFYLASKHLREVQATLKRECLDAQPIHDAAHAWRAGRSAATAAAIHVGKRWVIGLDIADFFPSIKPGHVYTALTRIGCSPDVARTIVALTTLDGHPAQGLVTSPVIANLVMLTVDEQIAAVCKSAGLTYTRYGDDITISGNHRGRRVVAAIRRILAAAGFALRDEKESCRGRHERQEVLGIAVNSKLNLPKTARRKYRALANRSLDGASGSHQSIPVPGTSMAQIRGYLSHWEALNPAGARRTLRKVARAVRPQFGASSLQHVRRLNETAG